MPMQSAMCKIPPGQNQLHHLHNSNAEMDLSENTIWSLFELESYVLESKTTVPRLPVICFALFWVQLVSNEGANRGIKRFIQ